jgi:hypothetical protein
LNCNIHATHRLVIDLVSSRKMVLMFRTADNIRGFVVCSWAFARLTLFMHVK